MLCIGVAAAMKSDIVTSESVVCPFSRGVRSLKVVCDNFVSGVPSCVVEGFYLAGDYEEQVEEFKREMAGLPCREVVVCARFSRSRFYDFVMVEANLVKCFFGGLCGFRSSGCFKCCRWKRE